MERIDPSSDSYLTIKEKVSGSYIDLDATYSNIVVYLYDSAGTIINKWSKSTQSGYDSLYGVDAYTYEFYIYRDLLTGYKRKKVKLEIKYVKSVASKGLASNLEHTLGDIWLEVEDSNMDTAA